MQDDNEDEGYETTDNRSEITYEDISSVDDESLPMLKPGQGVGKFIREKTCFEKWLVSAPKDDLTSNQPDTDDTVIHPSMP